MPSTLRLLHARLTRVWMGGSLRWAAAAVIGLAWMAGAGAQETDLNGRPIREITFSGLGQILPRYVENQVRSAVGSPYDDRVVQNDIERITNLGFFSAVTARVLPLEDRGVSLNFEMVELPILTGVEIRGNRQVRDNDLWPLIRLRTGDAVNPFLIDRDRQAILDAYEEEGFFVTDVTVDQPSLEDDRRLVFLVREGPRIRLRQIEFEGNRVYPGGRLRKQIRARTWFPVFGSGNVLDREALKLDAARLRDYYQQRGYLEAEVDRRISVSDDQKDGRVTFLITEGPQWTVGDIRVQGFNGQPLVLPAAQVKLLMELKPGDVYSANKLRASANRITDHYGQLGYLETRLVRRNTTDPRASGIDRQFNPETNTVDLLVTLDQGVPSTVGKVIVRGNSLTRTKVVLRELRGVTPGRPFDRTGLERSRRRLNELSLFGNATITLLGSPADQPRDVLVEVAEQNTGSVSFGATISSDDGLLGAIDINQTNFDITDLPESVDDILANRAFRGGGQRFNLTLSPGSDNSRYSVGLADPYFLDTDYFADSSIFFFESERDEFDEERAGARLGLGKRFGDVWSAAIGGRVENIEVASIDPDASVDVFEVGGTSLITGVNARLTRSTTDSSILPSSGSRAVASIERTGVFGGDFDFTKASFAFDKFWTVSEDFLGRKSILRFRFDTGYIFEADEAPVFERFFAGGQSSFRGFDNRGIGPRGITASTGTLSDDSVGADFLLLAGVQYEVPLIDRYLRGVVFTDQGTLDNAVSLEDWRVSVGFGVRIAVPFLSQAPFAVDFAIPLVEEETDENQTISFAIDIPLR